MRNLPQVLTVEHDYTGENAKKRALREYGAAARTLYVVDGPKCRKAVKMDSLKRDISIAATEAYGEGETRNTSPLFSVAVCAGKSTDYEELCKSLELIESYWKKASKFHVRGQKNGRHEI